MNNDRILMLLDQIKTKIIELESELKSNPNSYLVGVDYKEILKYYDTNDNDGEEGL